MGSFNHTCGLSGQSIGYGNEDCKLIFIAKSEDHGSKRGCHIYPTCQWYPVSFAMSVTYDDYGLYIVDEESLEWKGFRVYLAKEIHGKETMERMAKENEEGAKHTYFDKLRAARDIPKETIELITPEWVFRKIHEGTLILNGGNKLHTFAIDNEIWEKWAMTPFQFDGEPVSLETFITDMKEEIDKSVKEENEVLRKMLYHAVQSCSTYNYKMMDYTYPWKASVEKDFELTLRKKAELYFLIQKMDYISKVFYPQVTSGGINKELYSFNLLCSNIAKDRHNERELDMGYPEKVIN
jgi:hypothetical protein